MYLFAGLGNIGKEYESTRHNLGFICVDKIIEKYGYKDKKDKFNATIFSTVIDEKIVLIVKPNTYMNRSGIAISQIKSDDLPQTANMSLGQMMSGKAPGMQVSMTSSQPGGGVWVQIRGNAAGGAGNNGPLYVIDGYPISTDNMEPGSGNQYTSGDKSPLNNLNPSDIESIEVLKDASATSIYGARAANGVVLITTKRGKNGQKPTVQYSGSISGIA